ncbi:MAG TPA: hypothetical protein VJT73_03350 [Polyangiaceae bacterium]|nr:hypothetical protein [Polyangiaceae bacterium]
MKRLITLLSVFGALGPTGCAAGAVDDPAEDSAELRANKAEINSCEDDGNIKAKGAFTCDFRLPGDAFGPMEIAPVLERDRMIMSREKGMLHKHLPIALDFNHFSGGQPDLFSGGRYLFDTEKHAKNYEHFVEDEFTLDGVQFLDRPYFLEPECHSYRVVGAHNFTDIHHSQVILRTERFHMTGNHPVKDLKNAWHAIKDEAGSRGMASVWVVYNSEEDLASVIYTIDRVVPYDPTTPDFTSLGYLAAATPLGHHLEELGFTRTFDRTHWVLTIWLPFVNGDHGEPSLWPHSPPFDLPFCGDGVCEVSRGENASTCSDDCTPKCGNGICQPSKGENNLNCPGDCGTGT